MAKRAPIEVFGEWAETGRDEGMASGHQSAVNQMLQLALPTDRSFQFLDAGCGNGWVVRKVSSNPLCTKATGVDGSRQMIEKARAIDPQGTYIQDNLLAWTPDQPYDVVHSMEVFYYLEKPQDLLKHICASWLNKGGVLVMGVDFYAENQSSHNWPEKTQINPMTLLSINEWVSCFVEAGFQNVQWTQIDAKGDWAGTLCVKGKL